MLLESDTSTGVVRVDDEGFAALRAACGGAADPEVARVLGTGRLRDALGSVAAPLVTLEVVVAGAGHRLRHRVWVGAEHVLVRAALSSEVSQLMVLPPGHLAAALTRLTRLVPRRVGARSARELEVSATSLVAPDPETRAGALAGVGADVAWCLDVWWDGRRQRLAGVHGHEGTWLVDDDADLLRPASPTAVYRLFTAVLPSAALERSG